MIGDMLALYRKDEALSLLAACLCSHHGYYWGQPVAHPGITGKGVTDPGLYAAVNAAANMVVLLGQGVQKGGKSREHSS